MKLKIGSYWITFRKCSDTFTCYTLRCVSGSIWDFLLFWFSQNKRKSCWLSIPELSETDSDAVSWTCIPKYRSIWNKGSHEQLERQTHLWKMYIIIPYSASTLIDSLKIIAHHVRCSIWRFRHRACCKSEGLFWMPDGTLRTVSVVDAACCYCLLKINLPWAQNI